MTHPPLPQQQHVPSKPKPLSSCTIAWEYQFIVVVWAIMLRCTINQILGRSPIQYLANLKQLNLTNPMAVSQVIRPWGKATCNSNKLIHLN